MNKNKLNTNTVNISGIVQNDPVFSHEIFGEKFYTTNILINRLNKFTDSIPILISDKLLIDNKLCKGDKLSIVGCLRSYNDINSKVKLMTLVKQILPYDDSSEINCIEIDGFICKQPNFRSTPLNKKVCDVVLAVNRSFNKSDYIPCILWEKAASFVKDCEVGTVLKIIGRIQSRRYSKVNNGEKTEEHVAYEVNVTKVKLG